MAQFLPEGLSDSYQGIVLYVKSVLNVGADAHGGPAEKSQ